MEINIKVPINYIEILKLFGNVSYPKSVKYELVLQDWSNIKFKYPSENEIYIFNSIRDFEQGNDEYEIPRYEKLNHLVEECIKYGLDETIIYKILPSSSLVSLTFTVLKENYDELLNFLGEKHPLFSLILKSVCN